MERLAYIPEFASVQLDGLEHLTLVDAKAPVSFFACPGKKNYLVPDGCEVHELAAPSADVLGSLEALVDAVGAVGAAPTRQQPSRPSRPTGVSDEAQTSGVALAASTIGAPRHDWLTLTGSANGQRLRVAVGAAIACPHRPVFALQADGSSLYTIQSLWTMAREHLDVTVVIFNNRSYGILNSSSAGSAPRGMVTERRPNSTSAGRTRISSRSGPASASPRSAPRRRRTSWPPLNAPSPSPDRT